MKAIKLFFILIIAFLPFRVFAGPIGPDQAKVIAERFFSSSMTRSSGREMNLIWSGSDIRRGLSTKSSSSQEDDMLYIFNSSDVEGYVIIAGDDHVDPVIGYSFERNFDVDNVPDALADLLMSWAKYISDMSSAPSMTRTRSAEPHTGNVVEKYETAKWSQSEPFNGLLPVFGGNRSITGCVATASSILMKYFNWPLKGTGVIPSYSFVDVFGNGRTVQEIALGHQYDYNDMLMDYSASYSSAQAEAVAVLMRDVGASLKMNYSYVSSSASTMSMLSALTSYFGYSKAARLEPSDSYMNYDWQKMLKDNIRNCGPTAVGAAGAEGRHMFILDGFTTEGYFSINFGWGGYNDGFYLLPDVEYDNDYEAVIGLVPDYDNVSEYNDDIRLRAISDTYAGIYSTASEFREGVRFDCSLGAVINAAPVPFDGSIRLSLVDADGKVVEENVWGPYEINDLAPMYYLLFNPMSVTVSEIREGYRLRIYFKGEYSDAWQWARGYDEVAMDEVILRATPEDIARLTSVTISKEDRRFQFTSSVPLSFSVMNASGMVVASGTASSFTETVIDMSGFTSGEYVFSFASGGNPYTFTLVL